MTAGLPQKAAEGTLLSLGDRTDDGKIPADLACDAEFYRELCRAWVSLGLLETSASEGYSLTGAALPLFMTPASCHVGSPGSERS